MNTILLSATLVLMRVSQPISFSPTVERTCVRDPARKALLVTGCGRSGTRYTSFVLRRLALDVPHERMGRDGTTSWLLAVDADTVAWGDAKVAISFNNVFHQLRHPLAVIPSCTTFSESSWRFIADHLGCDLAAPSLVRAAQYWLRWNTYAEQIATWRYQIEELPLVFPEFCERLGVPIDQSVLARVETDVNTRHRGRALHLYDELCERVHVDASHRLRRLLARKSTARLTVPLTWSTLAGADVELAQQIREKAREYGYRC